MLKIFPLLWREFDQEMNPEIHQLARRFAEENLEGMPRDDDGAIRFNWYWKVWLLAKVEGEAIIQPEGIMALRQEFDVPLFHMRTPSGNSRPEIVEFAKGYEMLAARGREFLQDQGALGRDIFVHVSKASENASMVEILSKKLKMRPANRYILEV